MTDVLERADVPDRPAYRLPPSAYFDPEWYERERRELFGRTCNQCHTLAASKTVGRVGPNLDDLRPPKSLVLNAIEQGPARGVGRMPGNALTTSPP